MKLLLNNKEGQGIIILFTMLLFYNNSKLVNILGEMVLPCNGGKHAINWTIQ